MTNIRFATLAFSVLLHGVLLSLAFVVSGQQSGPVEKIYHVSLAEFAVPASTVSGLPREPVGDSLQGDVVEAPAPAEPAPNLTPVPEPEPEPEPESVPKARPEPLQKAENKSLAAPVPVKKKKSVIRKKQRRTVPSRPQAAEPKHQKVRQTKSASTKRATPEASPGTVQGSKAQGESQGKTGAGPVARSVGGLQAYDVDVVDQRPAFARRVMPEYPANARRKNLQGKVVVRVVVDMEGKPRQCSVQYSEPQGVFDKAALAAARKTRFIPGKILGKTVNTLILIPYQFALR